MRTRQQRYCATVLLLCLLFCAEAVKASAQNASSAVPPLSADLSIGVVEQILADHPTPASLGKWGYTQGLTLYAIERVYRRTHEERYLRYIRAWAELHVDKQGKIDKPIDALDDMLPGILMLALYEDTADVRYKLAAEAIRKRFETYPRTADGGLWHGAAIEHEHELWLDGMYMSMPFFVHYADAFGGSEQAHHEAARQLLLYAKHLNDPKTGLLFHAYDETGEPVWALPGSKHSSFFWGRSIGWYSVALVEVLETMPRKDPDRPELIALVRQLVAAFERYQDPATGLWYNVVDKAQTPGNWLETSASSMYIYTISKAVERGYVNPRYAGVACKAYRGIRMELSASSRGAISVANICAGTVVGDLDYYLKRPRKTNDIHGVGPFLLMNEQMRARPCTAH